MASSIAENLVDTAFAFRGYGQTNLGRTRELFEVAAYRAIMLEELKRFGAICSETTGNTADLLALVERGVEPGLDRYAEAISLIVASEVAQMRLLREIHEIDTAQAKLTFGYSLGELVAVGFGGIFPIDQMARVPLALAEDSAKLTQDTMFGVLFSRGPEIHERDVLRLSLQITSEGHGTIGPSAILSPNTYLLIGQGNTVMRFKEVMHDLLPKRAHLRINENQWPPLHTPIVRQSHIADRASVMLERLSGGFSPPAPPVLSLVTGEMSYDDYSSRDILRRWIDQPQRLWEVVDETLALGIESIVHVGPAPNVIPATFRRLSDNVREQTSGSSLGSLGMRAISGLARRPWLAALLPSRTSLLRAPQVSHIILEDWLLEHVPE